MIVNIISTLSPEQALPSSTTSDLIGPVNYNFSYDNFNRLTSASGSYIGPNDVVNTQSQGGNPFLKHEYNLDLTYDAQDPSRNFINKTQTHLNKPVSDLNEPMENASVVKNNSYQLDYTYDDDGGLIAGSNYGYTQPHAVREIKEQPTGVNCCGSQDDPRIKNQNIKHDANGNLTKVIEGVGEEEITKIHYLWDEENRLMAADLNPYSEESDHPIATYTYDAGGERIIKYLYQQVDIHSNAKDVGNARKTETYIYPDGMITAKVLKFIVRDQALSYTKHYHIGSQRVASKIGTSERFGFYSEQIIPLANLANADGINLIDVLQDPDEDGQNFNHLNERRNRILQAFDIPPLESETVDISEDENVTQGSDNFAHGYAGDLQHVEVFYFHSDHLGSSNYVSNYDGDISQHAEYLPFGELLTDEHLNSHNTRYKYNGKEFDQETGNYYYGARYYNPKNSLWLSVDPLAEKFPGWSPYNFVMNNPINMIDPDGRAPMSVDGEYEITHDKDGNEVKTKVSTLGDDVGIDFNHHLDGDKKGQTEIVNTNNGFTNWISDSRFMRGYTQRDESTNWESVYDEWQSGTGPENSLFFGRDNNMIKDIRTSNLYHGARNDYLKAKAWDFDNKISKKYIPIDFGLSGLLLSGTNMTMQMMGSGGASFYDIGNNQRLTIITDQKTKESFYYHLPWINNINRTGSGTQPKQSTTNQTYIWIDNNVED